MNYQQQLHAKLQAHANAENAPKMQAYMKSDMPFLGIRAPVLRKLCKTLYADWVFDDFEAWQALVLSVWREAAYREVRYAVLELCGHKLSRPFQTLEALPLYEEFIVSGAWWDYIDWLASQRLGHLLAAYPGEMKQEMRVWSRCGDLWKRRSAILCQLKFKSDTDFELMQDCIEPAMASKEFFLRKAIGWALRNYARVEPEAVRAYVLAHEAVLSPLSKREALKHLR